MKLKSIVVVLLLLAFSTVCIAGSGAIKAVIARKNAGSCSATQQSDTTGTITAAFNNGTYANLALSFTAATNFTIYHATLKLRRIGAGSVGGTGNVALYLCTNNATPTPDEPTATCTQADGTVTISTIATGGGEKTYDFAAGYAVTATNRYWLQGIASVGGDASNYLQGYYNNAALGEIALNGESGSWHSLDADAMGYHTLSSCP